MLFQNMTAAQVKEKHPELYASIVALGMENDPNAKVLQERVTTQEVEILKLKTELSSSEREMKIFKFAAKQNKAHLISSLVTSGKQIEDVYEEIVSAKMQESGTYSSTLFRNTAPSVAGSGSDSDTPIDPEIKTKTQAEDHVRAKYNLTSQKDVVLKARREFPALYIPTFGK